jgi:hypothetical protein
MSYTLETIYILNLLVKVLNGFKSQPNIFFLKTIYFFISFAHFCNANYTTYWQYAILVLFKHFLIISILALFTALYP